MNVMTRALLKTIGDTVLEKFPFSLKITVWGDLVNTMNGERKPNVGVGFPKDRVFIVLTKRDIPKLIKDFQQFLATFKEIEKIYPSTKWAYDKVNSLTLLISKQWQGGCCGRKNITKFKRSCKNPGNRDNLCFWRCLAIELFKNKQIIQPKSTEQKEKALMLKQKAEHKEEKVALTQVSNIP